MEIKILKKDTKHLGEERAAFGEPLTFLGWVTQTIMERKGKQ